MVKTIEVFDDFCHANDPHEEHDFGEFGLDGVEVIFKIDYYDCHALAIIRRIQPIHPSLRRVITLMLAEEY